jgi:RES domain-containing protein
LLISFALLAASHNAWAGSKVFKNNVLTAQHVAVPGTHIVLVPPSGAKLSSSFAGFEIESRGIRCEIREVSSPYAKIEPALTPEGVEDEGVKARDISDVDMNGTQGKIILGTSTEDQAGETGVVMFVLGNERFTVYIIGYYPQADKAAQGQLRNSMLSAIMEPKQEQRTTDPYTISTAGTEFKLADEVGATKHFTVGGQMYTSVVKDAIYSITSFSTAVSQEERAGFADKAAESFLSQYEHTTISRRDVNYDGLPGMEIVADVKGNFRLDRTASGGSVRRPIPARGYVAILFDPNSDLVYSFTGIAIQNAESYLSQFIRITSTFSRPK